MKRLLCLDKLLYCLLLSAVALGAAELTGKWSGSFDITNSEGETRPDSAYMDLKNQDGVVTGTAGPNTDKQFTVQKGKLEGQKLTFEVTQNGAVLMFELTFDGDLIQGTCSGTGENGEKLSAKVNLKRLP